MLKNIVKWAFVGAVALASALPARAQYVCFPTCAPQGQATVDGKFLSLAGSALATFNSDAVTIVFGLPATATQLDFGIFDGNTTGQWESAAGTINLTYTLYEDPLATGTGPVQVAQWVETDFPDNAWLDLSLPVGPGALAPSGTAYFYRLRIEASNAQPLAWTNFKVRTADTNSLSLKPQAFNFTGARFTAADLAVIYPAFPSLTPTRYDGRWRFFARIGASTDTAEFWDGDLDRGSADCTSNDLDDPDTPGAPFMPPWAAGTSAYEGVAVGETRACGTTTGSPPDDVDFASFLRSPPVTYTVFVPGDPTPYLNSNPSGNLEWERFVLSTIPGSVPASADYEVPFLPSGIYEIEMTGMDMRNFNSWFIPFEVLGVCEEAGNDGPETPTLCSPDFSPFLVGDFVWHDLNGDGIQDGGEPGLAGVTVCLLDSNGNTVDGTGDSGTGCTTTDANGIYRFEVEAGTYTVRVEAGNLDPGGPLEGFTSTTGGETQSNTVVDDNILTYDFGYNGQPNDAALGDRVWYDTDGDGIQDGTESGITGVTVRLLDSGGNEVASDVTDGDGLYGFTGLAAGSYTVELVTGTLPLGLVPTYDLDGIGTAHTTTVTLAASQVRDDVDFGYRGTASLGDRVWLDLDGDGVQDGGGETGINGVTVELLDGGGAVIGSAVTAGDGNYTFSDLDAGTYSVRVVTSTLPAGLVQTYDLDGTVTAHLATATLDGGEARTDVDFGYRGTASLGDRVWLDLDGDGVQDGGGETGINGVTVELLDGGGGVIGSAVTSGDGNYTFGNLTAGTYSVRVVASTLPAGLAQTYDLDGTGTAHLATATLAAGQNRTDVDFGYRGTASLGDRVWLDLDGDGVQDGGGETGINGVTVELLDGGGGVIGSAVTSGDGNYTFGNLTAGTYSVRVVASTLPAGLAQTYDLDGTGTANTAAATLAAGQNRTDVDFGYRGTASLGDRVWTDTDGDGVQDGGETGINGVTVELLDAGGTVIASQVTAGDGNYAFGNLSAGNYTVRVVSGTLPPGVTPTYDLDGTVTPHSTVVALAGGQNRTDVDFGYRALGSIGDRVWSDTDGDGVQDGGETGINGVTVELLDSGGTVIASQVTAGDGNYDFTGLPAGSYSVRVVAGTLPAGVTPSFDFDGTGTAHIAAVPLAAGQTRTDIDFGYQPPQNAKLGDRVWNDLDNDGVQDGGENGINGITVELLNAGGVVIASQVTAGDGNYQFTGLAAGTYSVRIVTATIPAGFIPTYDLDGLGTLHIATATLAAGENRTDVDFGYWCPPGKGSIGDRLWYDNDADGVQDGGETGIVGVTVRLLDQTGAQLATTVTGANGIYNFPNLAGGNYTVEVVSGTLPGGLVQTYDLDGIGSAHRAAVTLGQGQNRTDVDFGYVKQKDGSIGDRVWFDIDRDGVQDPGEPGWNGRTVRLRIGGASGTIVATQVTSGDGNYLFVNRPAGQYTVEVVVSGVTDLVRTYDLDGTSSANRATFTLGAGQNRRDVDFGYALRVKPILECVVDNKDDTFTAYFGYQNSMPVAVPIAIGSRNKFSPTPTDRGQPTVFQPGRTPFWPNAAFSVTALDWQTLVWTLDGKTASATDKSTPCSYHVFFEKEWVDSEGNVSTVPPASISPDFEIYAESEIGKVHCYYPKDSTKLQCDYWNQQPPATDNNGLWVPVGTEYWVTEKNLPPGWNPTSGTGTFPAPNGHCVPGRDGIEKYCTHKVTNSEAPAQCADPAVFDPTWGVYFGNHALWLPGIATDLVFDPRGRFYEFANGSARLTGIVRSASDPKIAFEVDLTFTGKTTTGTPHKELKPAAYSENGGPVNTANWYYYPSFEGSLIGIDDMAGADLWLFHDMSFQIGFGANGKNLHYGASGWLSWDVKSQPKNGNKVPEKGKGDINIDLKDCPTVLAPVPN